MYQRYLEPQRQYADFIVGEETDIAADVMGSKIREMLQTGPHFKKQDVSKVSESLNIGSSLFAEKI